MRSKIALAALLGLSPLLPSAVLAQQTPASTSTSLIAPAEAKTERIEVRNVPADVMAFWLDPENQKEPVQFQVAHQNAAALSDSSSAPKASPAAGTKPLFSLQEFGEPRVQLRIAEKANALEVMGTPEQIKRTRDLVEFLDRPLRQVELEFHHLRLHDSKDIAALCADKSTAPGPSVGNFVATLPLNGWQARLGQLVKDKRALVKSSPRVTAINNLSANLSTTEKSKARMMWNGGSREVLVESSQGYVVTPTINTDDTITLAIRAGYSLFVGEGSGRQALKQPLTIVANVRDGDTVAISGGVIPVNEAEKRRLFEGKALEGPRADFILVTARIVRLMDEAGTAKETKPAP